MEYLKELFVSSVYGCTFSIYFAVIVIKSKYKYSTVCFNYSRFYIMLQLQ